MQSFNALWLRAQATQQSALNLAAYNTALAGHASVHAMQLGLTIPRVFLSTLARAEPPRDQT